MSSRSRKRGRTTRPAPADVEPGAPPLDRAAKTEAKNQAVRSTLEPLAPGERPPWVTYAAICAGVLGLLNVVLYAAGVRVADASFASKRLVMHARDCSPTTIRIPIHVGDDRSRTWVVNRTERGLRLKHDHRDRDGSEDKITQYGGDTSAPGTSVRQEFPADAFTKALLVREGNTAGANNVWAIEVDATAFAYELRRPGRFFRVEFDLSRPIEPPPAPWGSR